MKRGIEFDTFTLYYDILQHGKALQLDERYRVIKCLERTIEKLEKQ